MKKRRSKKQKQKSQVKRKQQIIAPVETRHGVSNESHSSVPEHKQESRITTDLSIFGLDQKQISKDLLKTIWVTAVIIILLVVIGLIQKGIINF